jgi:hypothetical protein
VQRHAYFVCVGRGDAPTPWDPYDPRDLPLPDCAYFGGVFRAFERAWPGPPLTIYVTKDPQWLPSYGDDVVALLLNDEWFRTPAYSGEVRAVLRNLAGRPWFPWMTLLPPTPTALVALVNHVRILVERALYQRRSRALARRNGWRPMRTDNAVDVPLGYFRQPDLAVTPYGERGTDLYFGGSLIHDLQRGKRWKRALKSTLGNPKQLYRRSMLDNARRYVEAHPGVELKATVTGDFRQLEDEQVTGYGSDMMDARMALVPRGTAAESYRLFEAWRYGCVPICEPQPDRWFYDGAPVVQLRSWGELEGKLGPLLADPARQRRLHEASLRWWSEVCSEDAVGARLAGALA